MTSIKVKFRPSSVYGKGGTIFYQIIRKRRIQQIITRYHIIPEEWDEKRYIKVGSEDSCRNAILISYRRKINVEIELLRRIIQRLELSGIDYSVSEVIKLFHLEIETRSFFKFTENLILEKQLSHKEGTSENYISALNSFKLYRKGEDMYLDEINAEIIENYEKFLFSNNLTRNTVSFYMRILRAIYNKAIDREIIPMRTPFKRVYTGIEKTTKRALSAKSLKKIKQIDLQDRPSLAFARDMFLLSFFMRGISFVDMAFLRKKDLTNGRVQENRSNFGNRMDQSYARYSRQI